MILPAVRDPRLVSIRRGGTLTETDHQLLAMWAASCADHVLYLFEESNSADTRPRDAIAAAHTWALGQAKMMVTRATGGHAMGAARPLHGAARFAAYAAGQAACVAHVPEHDLGAAAYAIKAVQATAPAGKEKETGQTERDWQRRQIPASLYGLVLEDQARRDDICWSVFSD